MTQILALPPELRRVPAIPAAWVAWRDAALLYRIEHRRLVEHDPGARAETLAACAEDPMLDQLLFGCYFEPRNRPERRRGWYPSIPFEFQIRIKRWIAEVMANDPGTPGALLGRGDGVLEKSRDMTGSWSFVEMFGHAWLYDDGFVGGLMSYKEELVEKQNDPGTLFFKLEGYLGLDVRVPASRELLIGGVLWEVPMRRPAWQIPEGYDPKQHNQDRTLAHPGKTNVITGFTTTPRTTVGHRLSAILMDEAGKYNAFPTVWMAVRAATDHAFALSSAETRYGTGFRDTARQADEANQRGEPGPAFLRLRAEEHPFRDELWRAEMEARHAGGDEATQSMAREFDLDYDAGHGALIYPSAQAIRPKSLDFRPAEGEQLHFCIDPASSRDMCGMHLVKYDRETDRYGLLASYQKTGRPPEFYASLVVAMPMTGTYDYTEEDERFMEWFDLYGHRIVSWVGDPAGKARTGSHRRGVLTSWYDDFAQATSDLTDGSRLVRIWSSDKHDFKRLEPRIRALRWLLERLDVNDEPDTRRTLSGLRDHRWPSKEDHAESTDLRGQPVRHPLFDLVTALEYLAAHRKHGIALATQATPAATRTTMSGKPWKARKQRGYVSGRAA